MKTPLASDTIVIAAALREKKIAAPASYFARRAAPKRGAPPRAISRRFVPDLDFSATIAHMGLANVACDGI